MKVGDYVRTKKGTIYQFNSTSSKALNGAKKYAVNSSPNIIDLIEVGDYVNGTKVTMIAGTRYDDKDLHCYCDYCENKETGKWIMIPAKDIKSIVTKEQFSSMEYRI